MSLSDKKVILDGLLNYITTVLRIQSKKEIRDALNERYYPEN